MPSQGGMFFPGGILVQQVPPGYIDPHQWSPQVGGGSTSVQPSGDTTGATDTANITAAMNQQTGPVVLAPGTFTASLSPVSFFHLQGSGVNLTTLNNSPGAAVFNLDTASGKIDTMEIDHMTISATGGDIFFGANMVRSQVHDCFLIQNSSGNAIMNVSASTGLGTTYLAECEFFSNREYIFGNPRTIEAWHLDMEGGQRANDNSWRYSTLFNQGQDTAMFHYRMIGAPGSTAASRMNEWRKLTFEYPTGGMIRLEGVTDATIAQCTNEDLAALAVTANPLLSFGLSAGGAQCINIQVIGYCRRGGNNVTTDIGNDAAQAGMQLDLQNCSQIGGGVAGPIVNLNGSGLHGARGFGLGAATNPANVNGYATRSIQAEGLSGSSQTLTTGGTITIGNPVNRTSNAGAVTGMILTAGSINGQQVTIINTSAGSVTFAASGTSNVADGTSDVIAANAAGRYVWNGPTSLWYRM